VGTVGLIRYAEMLALGIVLEASAYPKPGNVHRLRDFADTLYEDFAVSAVVAVEPLYRGIARGYRYRDNLVFLKRVYGDIIYDLVLLSMRTSGGGNTCLGTAILLTPIAVSLGCELASKKDTVDSRLLLANAAKRLEKFSTPIDTVYLYRAVRVASPSYIKDTDSTGEYPSVWSRNYRELILSKGARLWDILRFSSSFDMVAREVVEGYPRVIDSVGYIEKRLGYHGSWNRAVVEAYLHRLSTEPDTLVIRKHGYATARYVQKRAAETIDECLGSSGSDRCLERVWELDRELAHMGVNPGSTADIIAVAISVYALKRREAILRSRPPTR